MPLSTQGQTDLSGTYYIGSSGYNAATPSDNYYVCPTEEWAFYVADNSVTGNDNGKPFLTTYKCRGVGYDATNAKWTIIKDEATGYYYIRQTSTGRYVVSNGSMSGNPDRIRVHLETVSDPNNLGVNALFNIYIFKDATSYYYVIRPMGITDGTLPAHTAHDKHKWLTVNGGNQNFLDGTTAKEDGPTGFVNTGGVLGIYTESDANGKFYLEDCIVRPTIALNSSNMVEITVPTGSTIIYTTDGTTPTADNGTAVNSTTYTFDPATVTTVKAVAVANGELSNVATFSSRLIQNQGNAWNGTDCHFYMVPGDEDGGYEKINTTSLFRPSMKWYFVEGGHEEALQYVYIVNSVDGKSLCYEDTPGAYVGTNSDNADKYKFCFVASPTAGTYNIVPYAKSGVANRYINKNGGNASANGMNLGNDASAAYARWKLVMPSELDKTVPFSTSDPATGSYSYYKIGNVNASSYYIVTGTPNVTTSNSASAAMSWYIEEAAAASEADWLTYYHIRNAVTGEYLYFTKDDNDAGACLETRSAIEAGSEDRYKFTWAKTADANVDYYIIPKTLKDKSYNQFSTLQRNSGTLQSNLSRAAGAYAWTFEPTTYTCATPEIAFSDGDNGYIITASEMDVKKYYTTGSGELTPTTGTLYSSAIPVATLGVPSVTIRAIAARSAADASSEASVTVYRVETPMITPTFSGTVELSCGTDGADIYYEMGATPGEPTTFSTLYTSPIENAAGKIIKTFAVKRGWINSAVATSAAIMFTCANPVIRKATATTFTIECDFPSSGVTIHYTTDGSTPTASSPTYGGPVSFDNSDLPMVVKAIAMATDYNNSSVVELTINESLTADVDGYYVIANAHDFSTFMVMVNGEGAGFNYKITNDIEVPSGSDAISLTFTGRLMGVAKTDGSLPVVSGLDHPLFNVINGGTVKNVILDNVSISGGTNVGAICCEATGSSRIYNCGVLATGSTVDKDEDGYDVITSCSSTIGGSGNVGGIVGLLDDDSRVINCFSYANITGGTYVGGIVGYNNVSTTATNLHTMVMNCMFYGDITGGTSKSPIYNGAIITNVGNNTGVGNYNYFRIEAPFIEDNNIAKVYNCALGAETRFLQRFEFYRLLLNSHRELAAWWVTNDADDVDEIMKWVLEPSQIGTSTPYPILKVADKYPSVVNIDAENAAEDQPRNKGGKLGTLTVSIQMGSGGAVYGPPAGAVISTSTLSLNITDKDIDHFNFNYYKVQLPYYNEVGTGNYTGNRVVTGWKIVGITGGTPGDFSTSTADAPSFNFADRNCTNKDLYGTGGSNRIFNQGAYWDVPEGVTAITIEPYWGKAVYLADANRDVVYDATMTTAYPVANVAGGQIYTNGVSTFNDQPVFTDMGSAISSSSGQALFVGIEESVRKTHTVYDYAVVLVGNYHQYGGIAAVDHNPYTVTTVDLDGDNEPDYSYMLRFDGRTVFHPVRFDFLNLIGLGMAQKSTGGTGSYNFGIMQPKFWFEVTNTALFRVTQFEYDRSDRTAAPYIVQGGVIEQWVSGQNNGVANNITYFLVGSNVWFKEFHRGTHQDHNYTSKHPPISVTGGDFNEFYLTGLYRGDVANYADNAECYINGGRFGILAGAAMEGIGNANGANNTGNITWQVQNADIDQFYGGGINAAHPVEGNISTTIVGGFIRLFCGGPKFGDMSANKTVVTNATRCTFGTFFGAGYGGNSYSRQAPRNHNNLVNFPHNDSQAGNDDSWNAWLSRFYSQSYSDTYGGVSTQFNYQFLPMSGNADNCARIFVEYVKFSLATCRNVSSTLTDCTVLNDFYGGGSLGAVDGPATSILDSCTVNGNVYGAGFSASLPTVEVDSIGFKVEPYYYEALGTYSAGVKKPTTTYTWQEKTGDSWVDNDNHILYTTENLDALGQVKGNVSLTITGNSHIVGDVYGGGALSDANLDASNTTTVNILGGTYDGNIYGGAQGCIVDAEHSTAVAAKVNGVVTVNIGAIDGDGNYSGNANLTSSSVYGCNNTNGSPQADVFVNVYMTARHEGTNTVADEGFAIDQVFGGGNAANYAPEDGASASTKKTTVHIYSCDNTVRRIFGGGNAAAAQGVATIIDGGRFDWVFGGGNGEVTAANVGSGGVNLTINGGTFNHLFNGSNKNGTIGGPVTATLTSASGCDEDIKEYFCGNNLMPITSDLNTTILCNSEYPVYITDLYGGSNLASIDGNVTLTVQGGIIDNVFGGSKGTGETDASISGNVTLNLYGGTIGNAFGGSNVKGTIGGTITVNVYDDSPCPLSIENVYGGGQLAPYSHSSGYPQVNIIKGTVNQNVFGGGLGSGATVTGTPNVTVGADRETISYPCRVSGDVFGGGNAAAINGNTEVQIKNQAVVGGNVFGGGNSAPVSSDTQVKLTDRIKVIGNVYGGGNQGSVGGNTKVIVNGTILP